MHVCGCVRTNFVGITGFPLNSSPRPPHTGFPYQEKQSADGFFKLGGSFVFQTDAFFLFLSPPFLSSPSLTETEINEASFASSLIAKKTLFSPRSRAPRL